jgi:hypothetical protein
LLHIMAFPWQWNILVRELLAQALLVLVLPGLLPPPIWLLLMARLVLELVQEPPPGLAAPVLLVPVWLALLVALLGVPPVAC